MIILKNLTLFWMGLLTVLLLTAAGCGSGTSQSPSNDSTVKVIGINESVRVLSESELTAFGPVNKLETNYVFPNADVGQLIRPEHFNRFKGSADVLRYLELVQSPFILMNMFDQIDYMILSTKVLSIDLFVDGKQQPEKTPFPIQSVYIKMKKPVDQNTFFAALAFSKLDRNKTVPKKYGDLDVYLAESAINLPGDEKRKKASIPDYYFSLSFPSKESVVFATGPKREIDQFYSFTGTNRGIVAQKLQRLDETNIDFAWLYDYSVPAARICALPFPEKLADAIFRNAHSLDLILNASAEEKRPMIQLAVTAKTAEQIGKLNQAFTDALTDLTKQELPGLRTRGNESVAFSNAYKEISKTADKIRTNFDEKALKWTAVLDADSQTGPFFQNLFSALKTEIETHQLRQKEYALKLQLESIRKLMTIYYSRFGKYPPQAICGKDGKPLLSWRVSLLQVMGADGEQFYKTFRLDEPWNGPHNSALMYKVPNYYRFTDDSARMFKTTIRIFNSPDTPYGKHKINLDLKQIEKPGQTFLLVSVDPENAVEWTKPDDLVYEKNNLKKLFNGSVNGIPFIGDPVLNLSEKEAESWIKGK